jgi:2-phospho-L-lactate guanylyltransferase
MAVIGAVPIKPFASSKQRLAGALPPLARSVASKEMAHRTLQCLDLVGADPLVMAADEEVAAWAAERGWKALVDSGDLNTAAAAAVKVSVAQGMPWLIVHADLPLLEPSTLIPAIRILLDGGSVISPSRDGGTTLIGSSLPSFRFAYGPGSFHAHLQKMQPESPMVLVDVRLGIDLDDPSDLRFAATRVGWLAQLLDTLHQP